MQLRIIQRIAVFALLWIATVETLQAQVSKEFTWRAGGPEGIFKDIQAGDSTLSDTAYGQYMTAKYNVVDFVWQFYSLIMDSVSADSGVTYLQSLSSYLYNSMDSFMVNPDSNYMVFMNNQNSMISPPPASTSACENIDFEEGNIVDGGWIYRVGHNAGTYITWGPYVPLSYPEEEDEVLLINKTNTSADQDPLFSSILKVGAGDYSLRLQDRRNSSRATQLERTFTVDPASPFFAYSFALILEDPGEAGHEEDHEKPFFRVELFNDQGQPITCGNYEVFAKAPVVNMFAAQNYFWRNWSDVIIPLTDYVNQDITIKITVADCPYGGHKAYAYVDFKCFNESITDLGCIDGLRKLEAPGEPYVNWFWTGTGSIVGDNDKPVVYVDAAGDYKVRVTGASGCSGTLLKTVAACPSTEVPCTLSLSNFNVGTCSTNDNNYSVSGQLNITNIPDEGFIRVAVGEVTTIINAPYTSPVNFTINGLHANGQAQVLKVEIFKNNYGSPVDLSCVAQQNFNAPSGCGSITIACANCIGSFAPVAGKKYVLSAWVSQQTIDPTDTTLTDPNLELTFQPSNLTITNIKASGKIIDGWQRVHYEFEIPVGSSDISIALKTTDGEVYFDDIRVYPIDGSLITYVYDPINLRLVAVLDENNYATLYEYDEDGSLTRVKKETERGILTVKESRDNNAK